VQRAEMKQRGLQPEHGRGEALGQRPAMTADGSQHQFRGGLERRVVHGEGACGGRDNRLFAMFGGGWVFQVAVEMP